MMHGQKNIKLRYGAFELQESAAVSLKSWRKWTRRSRNVMQDHIGSASSWVDPVRIPKVWAQWWRFVNTVKSVCEFYVTDTVQLIHEPTNAPNTIQYNTIMISINLLNVYHTAR